MLFRMKDEKAHQLEAELDKLQADGPAAWAKLPEEELFTPAGFSEERAEATSYSNYSYWGSTFRAFFKNRVAVLLLVALIAVVAFAFLQPCLPGQADPNLCAVDPATGIQYRNIAPGEKGFIWGSNAIGQDLWARIWAGARTSLTIAFFVALIEAVVGITVGVLWGYVRQLDFFFTELYNICDNVPSTIILILISYVASPSVQTLILGMSITGWIAMARFIRNQILIIRDRDYNVASRCIGTPTSRIVVRNLLPYLVSVIMLRMALTIPAAIGSEVFITYIGLGLSVEVPSLGNLINDGRKVMMQAGLRYQLLYPTIILSFVTIAFYLIGNAFSDAADPKNHLQYGGTGMKKNELILSVRDLNIKFNLRGKILHAIRGIDLDVYHGEVLAIVGESGSGKSVFTKSFMGLLDSNGSITSGTIDYFGADDHQPIRLSELKKEKDWLKVRGHEIAMIMQDPMTSLNPLKTIGDQIMEAVELHQGLKGAAAREKTLEYLRDVGIADPEVRFKQYPHEFSGGMRQRVVIAIAVACNPQILICDEPTTALDVTIQAQILELLKEMRVKYNLTIILITHDLGVVANIADRVAVMYAGDIVEIGTSDEIYYDPRHPYTWALLSSMPQMGVKGEDLFNIQGTPPNLFTEIHGDAFAPRNPLALKIDFVKRPPYFDVSTTHRAKTWLLDPRAPKIEPPAAVRMLQEEGK